MMQILRRIVIVAFFTVTLFNCTTPKKPKTELTFLHTAGQDIVNESGEKVLIKLLVNVK